MKHCKESVHDMKYTAFVEFVNLQNLLITDRCSEGQEEAAGYCASSHK